MPNAITLDRIREILPARPQDGHKGTFGHVLILAGSERYLGAARLAGNAAARSGVGLVTLGVPGGLALAIAGGSLETMTAAVGDLTATAFDWVCVDDALGIAAPMNAVALGPGLTQEDGPTAFVLDFVPRYTQPLLIDADGLNCLSKNIDVLRRRSAPTVVTPHPGEMARLADMTTAEVQGDRAATAKAFATEHGCVVALKGANTIVASPDGEVCVNTTGNSGLATGGTGDVLTGLISGLLAQGMNAFDAACAGVFVHGLAGDFAAEELSQRGMTAPDVVTRIPKAWLRIEGKS